MTLAAPFPYFGGKSKVVSIVWDYLGDVKNYVEPFAGSAAVLLARPTPFSGSETLNDWSCQLVNAWRAIAKHPEALFTRTERKHRNDNTNPHAAPCRTNS